MKSILALLALVALASIANARPVTVSGRLVAFDGSPMRASGIALVAFEDASLPPKWVSPDRNGEFEVTVPGPGVYTLVAHGVDHMMHRVPILLADEQDVELEVRLGTYARSATLDSLRVIGTFNGFEFRSGAVPMTLQSDGTFAAEIPWTEATLDYQILGLVPDHSVNGTTADSWSYDGGGDYQSTIDVRDGVARIVLDPARLPAAGRAPSVEAKDPSSKTATFLRINGEMERRENAVRAAAQAWQESGGAMREFRYDNAAELAAIAERIRSEKDRFTRQLLLLSYIDAQSSTGRDSTIGLLAMNEIEPESLLWMLDVNRMYSMYRLMKSLKGPMTSAEYSEKARVNHPSGYLRGMLTLHRLESAHYEKDSVTERRMYDELLSKYPKSPWVERARAEYGPDRAIMVGKKIPSFAFASLTDTSIVYDERSFLGRYYLIDFWATWCGPCIGEMENMHAAYEKFHGRNFEILSLSFDATPETVTAFIAKKWKMPWHHSFVDGAFGNPTAVRFGVTGIPKPILVGPDGTIVATEEDLRGESLEKTLARLIGG